MRIAVIGQQNFHDVETKNDIGIVQQTQPGKTSFGNAQLLLSVYCLDRPTKIFVTARFHFDENERVAVAADDVDLASAAGAKIPVENFAAVAPQESASQFLPARRDGDLQAISASARSGCATGSKERRWIGQGPNS